MWRRALESNGEIRTRRCTPPSVFAAIGVVAADLDGSGFNAGLFALRLLEIFHLKTLLPAQRVYMRNSISAQSWLSVPPAPAWTYLHTYFLSIEDAAAELDHAGFEVVASLVREPMSPAELPARAARWWESGADRERTPATPSLAARDRLGIPGGCWLRAAKQLLRVGRCVGDRGFAHESESHRTENGEHRAGEATRPWLWTSKAEQHSGAERDSDRAPRMRHDRVAEVDFS